MTNWEQIKEEYMTTSVPLCALAQKYGVRKNKIYYRAMRDGWREEKKAFSAAQEESESLASFAEDVKCCVHASDIERLVDKLYQKANFAIDALSDEAPDTQRLRHLVQSVKDLKDLAKQEEESRDVGRLEALIKGLCEL